jgi:hypothetical protein
MAVVVESSAHIWPREVFDLRGSDLAEVRKCLDGKGVYVLFRNDQPHYVGKTKKKTLFSRIKKHATTPRDRYYHFWNYFSAFVVPTREHRDEIEGILIASIPTTANSANPRMQKIRLPNGVRKLMHQLRRKDLIALEWPRNASKMNSGKR